jgi:hypothetical protein
MNPCRHNLFFLKAPYFEPDFNPPKFLFPNFANTSGQYRFLTIFCCEKRSDLYNLTRPAYNSKQFTPQQANEIKKLVVAVNYCFISVYYFFVLKKATKIWDCQRDKQAVFLMDIKSSPAIDKLILALLFRLAI